MWLNFQISSALLLALALAFGGCESADGRNGFDGYLEGDYRYIAAPFGGKILKMHVKEGQSVKNGDVIFELENVAQRQNLEIAKANLASLKAEFDDINKGARKEELDSAKAALEQAKSALWIADKNYARAKSLQAKDAVSTKEIQSAKAEFDRAKALTDQLAAQLKSAILPARIDRIKSLEAKIEAAQAELNLAVWRLDETRVKAAQSGLIERVFYEEGEWVSAGRAAVSLLPKGALKAKFYVPLNALSKFKAKTRVQISCSGCPNLAATVTKIASEPEYTPPIIYSQNTQETFVYRVEAALDEPNEFLHPSLPINVRLAE